MQFDPTTLPPNGMYKREFVVNVVDERRSARLTQGALACTTS